MVRRLFAVWACVAVLVGCGAEKGDHEQSLYVFGTKVDILLRDVEPDTADAAFKRLEDTFNRLHVVWHAWKPGELVDLNLAIKEGQAKQVSPDLRDALERAKALSAQSDGLFNPAIGAIVGAWGFHNDDRPEGHHPDLDAIRAMAARGPSMEDVHIEGHRVFATNAAVQLDFGAFAKGLALDRAETILADLGIEHALINAGGDLNTLGGTAARPWTVGIRDPKAWGLIARVTLAPGEDVYTSGNYERFREIDGVRYAHIIDPRTGMPVEHIVSATVIARNGALADAAATALSVAGPDGWHRIAQQMGLKYVALVDDQGRLYVNPAMRERLELAPDQDFQVVQSPPL